jgi:hypothetical protein
LTKRTARTATVVTLLLFACGRTETSRTEHAVTVDRNDGAGTDAWTLAVHEDACPSHVLTVTVGKDPTASRCFAKLAAGGHATFVERFEHPTCIPGHIRVTAIDDCDLEVDRVSSAWTGDDCAKHSGT